MDLLVNNINKLHGLWNPEVQFRIQKGSPIIPILIWINPIPRIDTYFFFQIHSNIICPSTLKPSLRSLSCRYTRQNILTTWPAHLNLLEYSDNIPHCGAFSTPHSHPSWAQIFASGYCFQITLVYVPPLI
jgi:hypothetical protein